MERTGLAVPLYDFIDAPVTDAPLRITVRPGAPPPQPEPELLDPLGSPDVQPPPQDYAAPPPAAPEQLQAPEAPQQQQQAPQQASGPIRLVPVDHQPSFDVRVMPVDYDPFPPEPPSPTQLSDDQLRLLASQRGRIAVGPHETAAKVGEHVIQGYRDYFDPFTKDDAGKYYADQPMTPNAGGKVPQVRKDWTSDVMAGVDIATLLPLPGGGAVKAIMAGAAAKGADLVKLAQAVRLGERRVHPDLIRRETGWFQGADGAWRFEIPDTNAQWGGQFAWDARQNIFETKIADLMKQREAVYDVVTGKISDQAAFNEFNKKINTLYREQDRPMQMGDVLDHPELYKQYPHAAEMPTTMVDLGGAVRGQHVTTSGFDANGKPTSRNSIELDPKTGANRLTALHEIQHEVQDVEGFARGGGYSTPEVAAEAAAQVGVRRSELNAAMREMEDHKMVWLRERGFSGEVDLNNPKYMDLANTYWEKHPDQERKLYEIQAATTQLNAAHQRALRDAYHRLAGEVESRVVEARAGMTPNELRNREPILDESVPRDRQIVIKPEQQKAAVAKASIDDEGAAARVNDGLHDLPEPDRTVANEPGRESNQAATAEARATDPQVQPGGAGGAGGLAEAQRAAADAAGSTRPLEGLPDKPLIIEGKHYVPGPIESIHKLAEDYMREAGLKYQPITSYREVQVPRAKRVAEQYEKMPHAPNDPEVKASYDAMIDETVAQLKALQKSGIKIEFIKPGMKDPYAETPRMAAIDVRDNNHLWAFPTDNGFGSDAVTAAALADNPLLRKTGIHIDGRELLANDAFRIVHDFFGHLKDGVGFRAGGEENAWRSHSRMYSPLARKAMTSETRGQNSWLNYGPHGDKNRTAKSDVTIYADQKTGLMPNWTHLDGAADHFVAPPLRDERGHSTANAGVDAPPNKSVQTVADPHRMMYPGIYENPRRIASEAAERVAPEDLDMKRLWGVSRGDLDEMAKGRVGNREPDVFKGPGVSRGALSAQNIQTPQNTQRVIDVLAEAGKHPGLKHADAWYILDPVYQHMEKMFGPQEAKTRFERLNTLMGMASPGSDLLTEIQRGTAANMKVEQGRFDEFLKHAGTPREFRKGPADLKRVEAHPYHRTAQAEPMLKYLETGKIQSKEPKVPTYVGASGAPETGFQTKGPVGDSHFSRGVGLADTRKGPTDVASSMSRSEYHTLQPWWQNEVAAELGLESVPAQARLWTALGPRTGVNSALGQGKLELLTKQIMAAAKRMNISPEKARDLILSGKAHAGMLAGGAVGGSVLADGLQDYVE